MYDFNVFNHKNADVFEAWTAKKSFECWRDGNEVFLSVESHGDQATVAVKLEEFKQWLEQINKIVNK